MFSCNLRCVERESQEGERSGKAASRAERDELTLPDSCRTKLSAQPLHETMSSFTSCCVTFIRHRCLTPASISDVPTSGVDSPCSPLLLASTVAAQLLLAATPFVLLLCCHGERSAG